jgi:hypothetical protein
VAHGLGGIADHQRTARRRRPPASTITASARGLGALALRVGRVLDIAAGVDAALLVQQRGADLANRSTGA